MIAISAIFYFLSQHPFWSMGLLLVFWLVVGGLVARWRNSPGWFALGAVGMVLGMANIFTGSMINAIFLNAFGTYGSAVVTHAEETNSTLNDQPIWAFDGVMQTSDGLDVKIGFDTMSASLYPVRNQIDLPPVGERFVVKYIPGFERNVAIMRDESPFGKRIIVAEARGPIDRAANQLAVSPNNESFKQEYREALEHFLTQYSTDAPPSLVEHYRAQLRALEQDMQIFHRP